MLIINYRECMKSQYITDAMFEKLETARLAEELAGSSLRDLSSEISV